MLRENKKLHEFLFSAQAISENECIEVITANIILQAGLIETKCMFDRYLKAKDINIDEAEIVLKKMMEAYREENDLSGHTDEVIDISEECYAKMLESPEDAIIEEYIKRFNYTELLILGFRCLVDSEVSKILDTSRELANKYNLGEITIDSFFIAFVHAMPKVLRDLLKSLDVNEDEMKNFFDESVLCRKEVIIPKELQGCFVNVTDKIVRGEKPNILGREKEVKQLINILSKREKSNAILTGRAGVGKTAIIDLLAWKIINGDCPEEFKSYHILSLNVTSLISGTMFRGDAEQRFELIGKFMEENRNIIIFIDEVHTILGAGAVSDSSLDFSNFLKPTLARDTSKVIGATTEDEYKKYFRFDKALRRRFEKIEVLEPKAEEVYDMVKNQVEVLSKVHNVKVSANVIKNVIFYASCFNNDTANPDRTLDLLDRAMSRASNKNKHQLTVKCIREIFDWNIEKFQNTDEMTRKSVAYHETGHYIVSRFGDIMDYTPLAMSIIPADGYLGVTVSEVDDKIGYRRIRQYYIDKIAMLQAGRLCERFCRKVDDAGASSDMEKANMIAEDMVIEYGMSKLGISAIGSKKKNTYEFNDQIEAEILDILAEGEKRAVEIINAKRELIDVIANELVEKGMLSKLELDKLVSKYSKK